MPTSKRLIVIISWCLHLMDLCKNWKFMQPVISFDFILSFLGPCPLQSHKCWHWNAQSPTYFDEEVKKTIFHLHMYLWKLSFYIYKYIQTLQIRINCWTNLFYMKCPEKHLHAKFLCNWSFSINSIYREIVECHFANSQQILKLQRRINRFSFC